MNKKEFIELLTNTYHISFDKIQKLIEYKNVISEINKVHNITRLDKPDIVYDSLLLESILPFLKLNINFKNNQKLLDIGSGNGIPGILLKIIFPDLNVTLLEANSKKCQILTTIVNKLQLNIEILNGRAEELIRKNNLYETFDFVTSRAVTKLINLIEISMGFVKLNGLIIEPKGINGINEYNEAKDFLNQNNIELINNISYNFNNKTNYVFVFIKNIPTNRIFPRTWNKIIKVNGK